MKSKKTTAERARKPLKSASPSHEIQAKKSPSAESNHGRILAALAIVLALSTIVVYAQTAHYGFIAYDDDQYVYENAIVKLGVTGTSLVWAATTFFYANWHPLTWISERKDVLSTFLGIIALFLYLNTLAITERNAIMRNRPIQ
jgi:hypothetical protein